MKLFLQKKCKIFERGGLRPQTPVPPAAGGFAPKPPASGGWGFAPRPPKQPPHRCEFLATRLLVSTTLSKTKLCFAEGRDSRG